MLSHRTFVSVSIECLYLLWPSRGFISNLILLISVSATKSACVLQNNTPHEKCIGKYDPLRTKNRVPLEILTPFPTSKPFPDDLRLSEVFPFNTVSFLTALFYATTLDRFV